MSVGAAVQSAYIEVGARVITYDRHHGSAGADAGGVALGFRTYVPPGTRVTGVTVAGRIATVNATEMSVTRSGSNPIAAIATPRRSTTEKAVTKRLTSRRFLSMPHVHPNA